MRLSWRPPSGRRGRSRRPRFEFVPGYDMHAATYVVSTDADRLFLKAHLRPVPDAPLAVPSALVEAGVPNILAPLRTLTAGLSHELGDGRSLVLYPFIPGRNAMVAGMTADQWRVFGATLRAVHDSPIRERFADRLPTETFGLAAATPVRDALDRARKPVGDSVAAQRLAGFLRGQTERITSMIERAEGLGRRLATRDFERVLCHADIHAANILVADDGRIRLVDWDGPMLAPRERDLLFVIGSRIARDVEPHEEAWFFEGYGRRPGGRGRDRLLPLRADPRGHRRDRPERLRGRNAVRGVARLGGRPGRTLLRPGRDPRDHGAGAI